MLFALIIVLVVLLIVGSRHFEHFADLADQLYQNSLINKNVNWGNGAYAALNYGARSTGGLFALDERNEDDYDDYEYNGLRTPGGAHVSA